MATAANQMALAAQARRGYVEGLLNGLPSVVQAVDHGARILLSQVADPAAMMRRRDTVEDLTKHQSLWLHGTVSALRSALHGGGISAAKPGDLHAPGSRPGLGGRQRIASKASTLCWLVLATARLRPPSVTFAGSSGCTP